MGMILHWLVSALGLFLAAYLLPGIEVEDFGAALIASVVIGVLDVLFGWIFKVLLFPIFWLLPGLVLLVIDAVMIYFAGRLMRSFRVLNFSNAFLAALILAVAHLILG